MANSFKIKTNRLDVHESLDGDWLNNVSMPLMICGSGTAQVNRVWGTLERMGDVGCLDRIQSAVLYDINNDTTRRITSKGRRMRTSFGTEIFLPQYIPTDTGFHRDPHGYKQYAGTLFNEQDKVVGEIGERADQLGTAPQLIIHFMGFGSHCLLGAYLHSRLKARFPQARSLVVLDIPRDPVIQDQMRDVWDEFMSLLPDEKFLVTDDRMGDPLLTDHKLACALATIEAVSQSGTQSGPTLTDVIAGLTKGNLGSWLGMSSINAYMLPMKKTWNLMPPFRRTRLLRGKSDELTMLGIRAVKDTMRPHFDLANYNDSDNLDHSMIFCSVPLKFDEVPVLESQIRISLDTEGFFDDNPYANIGVASANMPSNATIQQVNNRPIRRNVLFNVAAFYGKVIWDIGSFFGGAIFGRKAKDLYMHCVRLYPLTDVKDPKNDIDSLKTILVDRNTKVGNIFGNDKIIEPENAPSELDWIEAREETNEVARNGQSVS